MPRYQVDFYRRDIQHHNPIETIIIEANSIDEAILIAREKTRRISRMIYVTTVSIINEEAPLPPSTFTISFGSYRVDNPSRVLWIISKNLADIWQLSHYHSTMDGGEEYMYVEILCPIHNWTQIERMTWSCEKCFSNQIAKTLNKPALANICQICNRPQIKCTCPKLS